MYTDFQAIGTRASDGSQIIYEFDANEAWVTYAPDGFDDLSSLAIYSPAQQDGLTAGFHLDNFVLAAVPVPAAVWLLGSALAAMGWMRRKPAGRA